MSDELSFYLLNIRGINKQKLAELLHIVEEVPKRVLCITETHEKHQRVDIPDGFCHMAKRREVEDKRGGGLMVIYEEKIMKGSMIETKCADLMHCKMNLRGFYFRMILVCMDVQDQKRNENIRRELNTILDECTDRENIIVLGDFNGHLGFIGDQALNRNGRYVLQLMENYNLTLLNGDEKCSGEITREENGNKSSIDFVLVNRMMYEKFNEMEIDERKEKYDISDHCLLEVRFNVKTVNDNRLKRRELVEYYSVVEDKRPTFVEGMEQLLLERNGVDSMEEFDKCMKTSAENRIKKVYQKRINKNDKIQPVWFTREIKEEIKLRKCYSKGWRITIDEEGRNEFKVKYMKQKGKVQELVREAITKYERRLTKQIKENKSGKKMWESINKLAGKNKKSTNTKLFDENGNKIEEIDIGEKVLSFWRGIYQKHENTIPNIWNSRAKETYEEKFGQAILDEEEIEEQRAVENFVSRLWRVAMGEGRSARNVETHSEDLRVVPRTDQQSSGSGSSVWVGGSVGWMDNVTFSTEDVKLQLKKLKIGKQAGPNALKSELYKWMLDSNICIRSLTESLNNISVTGPPAEWRGSKTVLIPKKNKPTCKDLRPIALMDTSYKLYMALCKEKLVNHLQLNDQFSVFQAGFTKSRRLEDNLIILTYCIMERRKSRKPLYVCAIDFEKAFDSVKRAHIVKALLKYRCDPLLIDIICQLYCGDTTSLHLNNVKLGEVEVTSGIRQGCTGSPLLFVMVLNHVIGKLVKSRVGFKNGVVEVPCLFFADDGLLLAQSRSEMNRLIDVLIEGAREVGLSINRAKSNVMVLGEDNITDNIGGIESVSEMKYLGVDIGINKDIFKQYKEKKVLSARRMANMTYSVTARSCNKVLVGKTFWKGVVLPSVLHGTAVVNWNNLELEKLQREEDGVWRKILGAPGYAPLVAMRGDIGTSTMIARDMKTKLKYLQYTNKSENYILPKVIKDMFEKKHAWSRKITRYMEYLGIEDMGNFQRMSEGELVKRIKDWDTGEWRKILEEKTTLGLYRTYKGEIKEEQFYDNTFGSVLLFRARTNCLRLGWRRRFQGGDVGCRACGFVEETLDHFLLDCPRLHSIRVKYGMEGVDMGEMLGFDGDRNMNGTKLLLVEMWKKRQQIDE